MKKVLLLAITAVASITILQAQSDYESKSSRTGFRIGGNINNVVTTMENESETGDGLFAFHLALTTDFRLFDNLYLSTGLWYITKGDAYVSEDKREESSYKYISSLSYLEVPLLASYIFPVSRDFRLRAEVGPYVAYGLIGKYRLVEVKSSGLFEGIFEKGEDYGDPFKKEDDEDYADIKRLDYGLRFGGAIEAGKLTLGVSYDFGLANILDGDPDYFSHHKVKSNTRSLLFSLGINF